MKKPIAAIFLLVGMLVSSLLTIDANAQKAVSSDLKSTPVTKVEDSSIQSYIKISSLTEDKKREMFTTVSPEQRANLWKIHLALALVRRPSLNRDQRTIITEVAALLTAEAYEKPVSNNSAKAVLLQSTFQRASAVFPREEVANIFFRLGGSSDEVKLLENFQSLSALPPREKGSFREFSPKIQSDLWRLHLAINLFSRGSLNQNQRGIIFDLVNLPRRSFMKF